MRTWAISGRNPIGVSWLFFVVPALMLNYMGQGAMILLWSRGSARGGEEPRSSCLRGETLRLPLVILATLGNDHRQPGGDFRAFSVTQQAIQLGFIPRLASCTPAHRRRGRSTSR
jgi:KUP system potassium uptake protein